MGEDTKVILVTRRTRLEALVAQYNTEAQAEFVIQSRGGDFKDYKAEFTAYQQSVIQVEAELRGSARLHRIEREFLPNFIFGPRDIVVVVGQDGLVANTLKYLSGQPVIAINPDPGRFDGVLLPFSVADMKTVFADVVQGSHQSKQITMAKASLNDGQELIAVNDFFIGPRYQISARYEISVDGHSEQQSSSGVIVSTGLGSSGWMKSVVTGAAAVTDSKEGKALEPMEWNSDYLRFAIREPFPSNTSGTELVFGILENQAVLEVSSLMAENGVIFSDGMVEDVIAFNSGSKVAIGVSEHKGLIVV
ncbi:diacylglycerol kinase catalytic domain-containing protein [Microbulbifer sp. 2201CG32-9]|uniref:sugar kinase n=1 Tax=Microbulbifer sp. 2201CG32-9 TaxID=3232309 RepID=UPI00345BDBB5